VVSGDHAHLPDIGHRTTDITKKWQERK